MNNKLKIFSKKMILLNSKSRSKNFNNIIFDSKKLINMFIIINFKLCRLKSYHKIFQYPKR